MPEIEINGKKLTVESGSTIMDAAKSIGAYIPHFCYHKKLSIAASCRMCLVEVEKSAKLIPACATPVADGMKVFTNSEKTKQAQQSVMEFLLINHPLDCPLCDQGGECKLQDISVGYGRRSSRFREKKRQVSSKEMGPLISAEEMSRCIHCSRCVRFSKEIAGYQEIGMANRAEDSEILSFFGQIVSSEVSGNVIDICPVGALTSMPFRFSARAWELSRRKSIAPHDGLGSNLIVEVANHKVKRVLPLVNESINECWLSDRDRFSYEALNSSERLTTPMLKHDGKWHNVDWQTALSYVAKTLNGVADEHGKAAIGVLANPISTSEELYLLQKLMRKFGVNNIDSRLRRSDFRADSFQQGAFWLGTSIDDLLAAQSVLLVGSSLRNEQPLLAARLRQSVKKGVELNVVHCADDNLLVAVNSKLIVAPNDLKYALSQVLKALLELKSSACAINLAQVETNSAAQSIANSLLHAERCAVLLGQVAENHPSFGDLFYLAQEIARISGASCGLLASAGNSVGAELAGAVPHFAAFAKQKVESGENALQMLKAPRKAYLLFNTEAEFECYDTQLALKALKQAESVLVFSSFKSAGALDYADALLPIAPFTETAGSFVNMAGTLQSFYGVVLPQGQTRPGWKVLRALANMLQLPDFEYNSVEEVRNEWLAQGEIGAALNNQINALPVEAAFSLTPTDQLNRIGEIPLYQVDALTRRASSLQLTNSATNIVATLNSHTMARYGLSDGDSISVRQQGAEIHLAAHTDNAVPLGAVRIPGAHSSTQSLSGLFDLIEIERD